MKKKTLKRKYGKLTVLSESTVNGRRYAVVDCDCGQQKSVLVDALTSGRTRSCGAYACKYGKTAVRKASQFSPTGSRSLSLPALRRILAAQQRKRDPLTIAEAAKKFAPKVKLNTVYYTLRTVRLCGGLDKYIKRIEGN